MVRVQISRIYGQTSCSVVQARTMVKSLNSNAVIEGRRNSFWQAFLKQVFSQQFHSRPHNVKAGHGYGQLYPWVGSRQYKNCNTSFEGNIGLALVAGLSQLKHLRNRTNNILMLSLWNVLIPSLQLRILLTFVIAVSCHPYESTEIENVNFTFYLHSHTLLLHMQNRCKEIFFLFYLLIYLFGEKHMAHSLHLHVPVWTEGWKQRIKKTPAGYFFLTQFVLSCCNNISVLTDFSALS